MRGALRAITANGSFAILIFIVNGHVSTVSFPSVYVFSSELIRLVQNRFLQRC